MGASKRRFNQTRQAEQLLVDELVHPLFHVQLKEGKKYNKKQDICTSTAAADVCPITRTQGMPHSNNNSQIHRRGPLAHPSQSHPVELVPPGQASPEVQVLAALVWIRFAARSLATSDACVGVDSPVRGLFCLLPLGGR